MTFATAEVTFLWLLLMVCFLVTYHLQRTHRAAKFPPSAVTILIGMAGGLILLPYLRMRDLEGLRFDPTVFWLAVLPPIIFQAGFNLKRKDFFKNFLPCFLFAVVGTAMTAIVFGLGAFAFLKMGMSSIFLFLHLLQLYCPVPKKFNRQLDCEIHTPTWKQAL